jgi:hypothetical protein
LSTPPVPILLYRKSRWELSWLGFPVLWQEGSDLMFGLHRARLLDETWTDWEAYLDRVCRERSHPPPDSASPLYRFAPERWLEAQVIRYFRMIRPDLQDVFYCQVPTFVEGDRKVIDLLGVTWSGRLVVVELKTRREPGLLFQGIEYWQRVADHLRHGDFAAGGYFPGISLKDHAPLLYLVTPWSEFHRDLALFRSYVTAEVEVRCLGIASDWRAGFRIIRRFRL